MTWLHRPPAVMASAIITRCGVVVNQGPIAVCAVCDVADDTFIETRDARIEVRCACGALMFTPIDLRGEQ